MLHDKIRQWAEDRNLIKGSTVARQFIKLMEEFGELGCALMECKTNDVMDAIGDCAVVLTIIAEINHFYIEENAKAQETGHLDELVNDFAWIARNPNNDNIQEAYDALLGFTETLELDFNTCLTMAYDAIKDRKGKMVNGVFKKE